MPPGQMNAAIEAEGLEADREWIEPLARHGHPQRRPRRDGRPNRRRSWPTSAAPAITGTTSPRRTLDPKFDVAGRGYRQPGSAWKPLVYAAGFDTGEITPGTLLLDVTTEFARGWVPRDADLRERGPVLVRDALTYSLNIPVIRALDRVGVDTVAAWPARWASPSRAATGTWPRPVWPVRSARPRRTWSS